MSVIDRFKLDGKSGFITGGARGIGKALADAFIDAGANIVIADIDIAEAKKTADGLAEKYNKKVVAVKCEVTNQKDAAEMVDRVVEEFGSIEIAVNNAGINAKGSAMDIDLETFRKIIDVNLNGVFVTAQAAARKMKELGVKNGSIISTASMSGHVANYPQKLAAYCTSKGGVIMLTKVLALEWAEYGIRVNCVSPGYILTDLVKEMEGIDEMMKVWTPLTPLGRLGQTEDLTGIYVFLASDASGWVTGADYLVDGGYTVP